MQLLNESWHRTIGKPNEEGLIAITNDQDKSCYELLLLDPKNGTVWRKRYWFKSSMGPAGEVWFRLIAPKRFHADQGWTKEDIARDILYNVLCDENENCRSENLSEENVAYLVATMVERMADEQAQAWVDAHEANNQNGLGGDYGEDMWFDNQAEIDDEFATAMGFPTIKQV